MHVSEPLLCAIAPFAPLLYATYVFLARADITIRNHAPTTPRQPGEIAQEMHSRDTREAFNLLAGRGPGAGAAGAANLARGPLTNFSTKAATCWAGASGGSDMRWARDGRPDAFLLGRKTDDSLRFGEPRAGRRAVLGRRATIAGATEFNCAAVCPEEPRQLGVIHVEDPKRRPRRATDCLYQLHLPRGASAVREPGAPARRGKRPNIKLADQLFTRVQTAPHQRVGQRARNRRAGKHFCADVRPPSWSTGRRRPAGAPPLYATDGAGACSRRTGRGTTRNLRRRIRTQTRREPDGEPGGTMWAGQGAAHPTREFRTSRPKASGAGGQTTFSPFFNLQHNRNWRRPRSWDAKRETPSRAEPNIIRTGRIGQLTHAHFTKEW